MRFFNRLLLRILFAKLAEFLRECFLSSGLTVNGSGETKSEFISWQLSFGARAGNPANSISVYEIDR